MKKTKRETRQQHAEKKWKLGKKEYD